MILQHILLFFLWTGFAVLHSFFAGDFWKQRMQNLLKNNYRFYRINYSVFALLTLGLVVFYHIQLKTIILWNALLFEKIFAAVAVISGATVMLFYIRRFFFDLSGADVFRKAQTAQPLITNNFYCYVRHPLYAATLVFVWSIFLWQPSLSNLISCTCLTIYTLIGIRLEEGKLIKMFGASYLNYRSKTPMLIPKLF